MKLIQKHFTPLLTCAALIFLTYPLLDKIINRPLDQYPATKARQNQTANTQVAKRKAALKNLALQIRAFRNVYKLRQDLGSVGLGQFREWRNDGYGWVSATNLYEFGPGHNLAFYLESDRKTYVRTIKLNLNRYRGNSADQAQVYMAGRAEETFDALHITPPKGLIDAIKEGEAFSFNTNRYRISTRLDEGEPEAKADYYRLTIESK